MSLRVEKGSIFVYRVFDIAEEIHLPRVELILRQRADEARVKLAPKSRDVVVRNAPIRFDLGDTFFEFRGRNLRADMIGTVWDYGALSICFQMALPEGISWDELKAWSSELNTFSEWNYQIDRTARARVDEVAKLLSNALERPAIWELYEDYFIFFLESVSGIQKPSDLVETGDLAELMVGESQLVLSATTRENILQNTYQYSESDFTLIDWNGAVVFEPTGDREILDILEFTLTHLLEVRYYDDLIDKRLAALYQSVEEGRSNLLGLSLTALSREANARYIEFSEFTERMGNSLKVVGDFYLARIYRGALRRFRISDWQENINRKMNVLAQVSSLFQGEANTRRSHLLEIIIILLILFEIVSKFWAP